MRALGVVFVCAAATAFAQSVPLEYSAEQTFVGQASVTRGSNRVVDFDETDTVVEFVFTPRIKLGVLRLGAQYERFGFGFGQGARLPNTLQATNAIVGLDTQFSDSILARFEAHPGIYSDRFENAGAAFNVPFEIGGTYIFNPDFQLVLGVGVDLDRKYPVLPGGGVRWKFASKWVLNAVLPTPRLEFNYSKSVTAYLGATLKETNFRVGDDFGTFRRNHRLNDAVLTYTEVRTGAGVDWKVAPAITLTVEAGYQPYRSFDFYRADIRYHEDGGAPYGMIGLHGAF
jgi:hypothetical protein